MKTVFNITDFGAIGDRKTICTTQIQTALDKAAKVKGEVIVPPGEYKVGKLVMREGVSLRGSSARSFEKSGASIFYLCEKNVNCMLDITHASGCKISEMCFDGSELGEYIHGIYHSFPKYNYLQYEDAPCIDDCRVAGFSGNGIHLEKIWCFCLRHSHLFKNKGAGIYIDGWDAFILDNWMSSNGNTGILGGPVSAAMTLTGNRVEWNARAGIKLNYGDSINVTGNFFDRNKGPGLFMGNNSTNCLFGKVNEKNMVRDATITGNIFRRNGKENDKNNAHIVMENCQNVALSGNAFRHGIGDDGKGEDTPDYCVLLKDCISVVLANNAMKEGCLKEKVLLSSVNEDVLIDNNVGI